MLRIQLKVKVILLRLEAETIFIKIKALITFFSIITRFRSHTARLTEDVGDRQSRLRSHILKPRARSAPVYKFCGAFDSYVAISDGKSLPGGTGTSASQTVSIPSKPAPLQHSSSASGP